MYLENTSDAVKQEAWRIAFAFYMDEVSLFTFSGFIGYSQDIRIRFWVTDDAKFLTATFNQFNFHCWVGIDAVTPSLSHELNAFIARGLFRAGLDTDKRVAALNFPLTHHEKLELRRQMPAHLHPPSWGKELCQGWVTDCEDYGAQRVASAFDATCLRRGKWPSTFEASRGATDIEFRLNASGGLWWVQLWNDHAASSFTSSNGKWHPVVSPDPALNSAMVRGLFRLGLDEVPEVQTFGAPLSHHEQLELRANFPFKFHPPQWGPSIGECQ